MMKQFSFTIRRTHNSNFERIEIEAEHSGKAIELLPDCVSWNFNVTKTKSCWQIKARLRLLEHAHKTYRSWMTTKQGKKFKISKKKGKSPYHFGFDLPDYHHDAIQALNDGDEEQVKYLMLAHFV